MIRTYNELKQLETFEERLEYLMLHRDVGAETFGFDRWVNQHFYRSKEWKDIRREVILRDNGCDLGIDGYDIQGGIIVHHMNPIMVEDIVCVSAYLLNPNFLIATSLNTHNAIHYSDPELLKVEPLHYHERTPNDTCPWKK